jgi:D-alanine-D-alanine ligase
MLVRVLYEELSDYTAEEEEVALDDVAAITSCLRELGYDYDTIPFTRNLGYLSDWLKTDKTAVVFPLVEGVREWSDRWLGMVQSVCEENRIPYAGNSAEVFALTSSKMLAKKVLSSDWEFGFVVPDALTLNSKPGLYLVKVCNMHGSWKLDSNSLIEVTKPELALEHIKERSIKEDLLFYAEEFIDGREFTAVFLDGEVFVAEQVFRRVGIETYDSKWNTHSDADENTYLRTVFIEPELISKVGQTAQGVWKVFGMEGWGRVDVRVKDGTVYVLDVNPNPCLGVADNTVRILAKFGYSQMEIVEVLIRHALRRHESVGGIYS